MNNKNVIIAGAIAVGLYILSTHRHDIKYCSLFTCVCNCVSYYEKMKIIAHNHSPSTKVSDLLMVVFSVAYFIAGLCFAQDLLACVIFLLCVIIIISIKYLKLTENE